MENKYKTFLFVVAILIFCDSATMAQNNRMVKNKSYELLLKKLLKHDVPEISVDRFHKIKEKTFLIDARELDEYNVSHIENARWVGYKNFTLDSLKDIDKNIPIIVYCSVGYRSEKITEKLMIAGFTDVQNLYGGIFEWKNSKHDVVDVNGLTNNVHPYNSTWGLWLKNANKVYQFPNKSKMKK